MSTTETRGGRVAPSKAEIDGARALAREVGLEYVDLDRYPLNAAAASLLPEQLARRHHALAVGWKYGTPVVAVGRQSSGCRPGTVELGELRRGGPIPPPR